MKGAIVTIDATPFRSWYESHYTVPLGRRKTTKLTKEEEEVFNKQRSRKAQKKFEERKKTAKVEQALEEQFGTSKVMARISSRPGQCGRADGYILEGQELQFYLKKVRAKKGK